VLYHGTRRHNHYVRRPDPHEMTTFKTKGNPVHVYLDQRNWIELARAFHERDDGLRFVPALTELQRAVDNRRVILPLSDTHLIETRKRIDLASRSRLAQTMSTLSKGWTIAPNNAVTRFELRAEIATAFNHASIKRPQVFARGITHAFGFGATLKNLEGQTLEMPEIMRAHADEFMSQKAVIEDFLCGGDQSVNLSAVEKFRIGQDRIAKMQEQFRKEARSHGHQVHKRACVANLTLAIQSELAPMLANIGKTWQDFLALGKDGLMDFFSHIPTLDVETELVVARNENWNKKIDANDSSDVTFLSVAIPYCDIVVTEKCWRHHAQKAKLDNRYDTVILDDLLDLQTYLN